LAIGDVAIGLASTGVHSNGFSLVRSILNRGGHSLSDTPSVLGGVTLGEALIAPTQIYVDAVKAIEAAAIEIHAMAHITGGGLPENLPRCLGPGQAVQIEADSWTAPAIFRWIAEAGDVTPADMFDTFNMGLGFIVFVAPDQVDATLAALQTTTIAAWRIGETIAGSGEVQGIPLVER
jgi:phosphoribosylformylglycinamidine cyclo-ligase